MEGFRASGITLETYKKEGGLVGEQKNFRVAEALAIS